jgi:hypothetical protein
MSAHDNADSQDSEAAATKMDSPGVNGYGHASLKNNGHPTRSSRSPHPDLKKESSTDANTSPIDGPGKTPGSDSGAIKDDPEMKQDTVGGDILVKQEQGQPLKLSRSSSQKVVRGPPQLFSHFPDSTADALATFEQIESCWYANKYMGYTEHAMECDCAEEWGMYSISLLSLFFSLFVLRRCRHLNWREESVSFLLGTCAGPSLDGALQDGVYPQRIRCFPLKMPLYLSRVSNCSTLFHF